MPRPPRDPGPNVQFPPPLLFVVPLGVCWMVDRVVATPRFPEAAWTVFGGLLLIACGFALVLSGIFTFRRFRTAVYPNRAAKLVVDTGPFAYTRNPMYVGMTGIYLGMTLLLTSWVAFALLPAVLLLVMRLVIRREERHLTEKFPEAYAEYCARVPRWLI
ncbi:MAG: isoprenylcysteine carboxylmethyltransferase family protein [Gemmatimonadaceae bacterium]|nr:isoprenylcysteine carboxylmethyltransferase family protein [Gemmatimonadaceae bacterium]